MHAETYIEHAIDLTDVSTNVERSDWLSGLVPGDEVAIVSPEILVRIERVASADAKYLTVQCGDARRYRRSDGHRVGVEHLADEHLAPVTQEHRDAVERDRLTRWLRALIDEQPDLTMLRALECAHRSELFARHLDRLNDEMVERARADL